MAEESTAEILKPQGEETLEQEESAPTPLETSSGSSDPSGTPTYGGKYRRYSFYGIIFEIPSKYIPIVPIGRGAYGIVCSAKDVESNEEVAIKKIGNAFSDKMDAKRTLREILLLRNMKHPNVIGVRDVIRPPNPKNFKDVYIVYELMPTDLHEVIRSGQPMDERHYRFILYQLLRGLKYIHSANVLHRDLKPPNILIDARCNVKITDFGLARTHVGVESHMTEYVVTRYYRAPELLLNSHDYSNPVDVWSLGCIYMELMTGSILLKGENYVDQLRKTIQLLGSPSESDISFIENESTRNYILNDMPKFEKSDFKTLFPKLSEQGADLVRRMLTFDPRQRTSVEDALSHPYLAHYHAMNEEPVHSDPFKFDLSFEQEEYSIARIRQLIFEQSCAFNPEDPLAE